jgi:aspartyl-tRNA(Asn)/glutamyl-tRNA(Gln) amidotransferase subunit A
MKLNLLEAKAFEIAKAVQAQEISALEVYEFFKERIDRLDKDLNSFISLNPEAESIAKAIDEKIKAGEKLGPLCGVPVAVKDLICTKNLKTTAASKMLENFVPTYSASLVKKLEEAGAVIMGKTSLDEFAMGSSNETSHFGVCKNPWDLERVPGGSSGGSAAAVAARLVPIAIGTDTGGSIRQPASFCGVAGLKPTYGSVSRYGVIAFASSLDQAGPMANYIEDCALVLDVISGEDELDATSADTKFTSFTKLKDLEGRKLKIGLPKQYFSELLSKDVKSKTQQAIRALEEMGHEFIELDFKYTDQSISTYYIIATSEASSNLSRFDGVRYGHRSMEAKNIDEIYSKSRSEAFGSEVKRRILMGTYALSSGYFDAYYNKACQVRRLIQDEYLEAFSKVDFILSPVCTDTAFKIEEKLDDPLSMYLNDILTIGVNLAGLPAVSIPLGESSNNMPIGLQLIGKHFSEEDLLSFSRIVEDKFMAERGRPDVY